MISQLASALSSGFTTKQVIDFIIKKFPNHADKIKSALAAGYTTDQVLKYLSGGKKALNEPEQATTEFEQTRNIDQKKRQNVNTGALAVGGLAASAVAAPMAMSALQRAIPASVQALAPASVPLPNQAVSPPAMSAATQTPQSPPIVQSQTPPVNAASIAQNVPTTQPEVNPIDLKSLLKDKYNGFKGKVDDLLKSGNGPEEISGYFRKFATGTVDKLEKESGQSIEKIVEQYISENPPKIITRNELQPPEEKKELPVESATEVKPISKNSTVITPNGVGEVKEIRNGQAVVEVDGKRHKIPEAELESPVFTDDEVADAYDNLMAKIPEKERSAFISWAGYDEERNVLGFIPRGGKYEELHNITPEEAQKIKEGKGVARTSGENREGLWAFGEDTRGGVISQIIHDRRKKHKATEEKQLKFDFGLEKPEKIDKGTKPIFDELSYARNLSRERDVKKKQEEKLRKKKMQDEERERKKRKK